MEENQGRALGIRAVLSQKDIPISKERTQPGERSLVVPLRFPMFFELARSAKNRLHKEWTCLFGENIRPERRVFLITVRWNARLLSGSAFIRERIRKFPSRFAFRGSYVYRKLFENVTSCVCVYRTYNNDYYIYQFNSHTFDEIYLLRSLVARNESRCNIN